MANIQRDFGQILGNDNTKKLILWWLWINTKISQVIYESEVSEF